MALIFQQPNQPNGETALDGGPDVAQWKGENCLNFYIYNFAIDEFAENTHTHTIHSSNDQKETRVHHCEIAKRNVLNGSKSNSIIWILENYSRQKSP